MSSSYWLPGLPPCSRRKQGCTEKMKALPLKPHYTPQSISFPVRFQPYSPQISSFLPPSVSSFPKLSCFPMPQVYVIKQHINRSLLKNIPEKLAVLLVGSLLFAGRFGRPALAVVTDAPKSSSAEQVQEKRETQMGNDVDEERYEKLLEQNPRDTEALKVLMYGKIKKGKTRDAVEYVERLIDVEPDEVEWRLLQALSYELMGQLSKAKRLFKGILEERPLLLRALHGLALVMHKNHEGQAVFDMLYSALEIAHREQRVTEERDIQILIAQMHVLKGDLERGLKQFQKLVEQNPLDFRPYLCQGIIYSLLDKKKEADEHFQIYQSLIPDEFPQRGFIDDVILSAKTESQEQPKEFEPELSYRK